jgi:periplasmic protein CpxP/Spy
MKSASLKYWKVATFIMIALNITLIVFLFLKPFGGKHPGENEDGDPGKYIVEKLKFSEQQQTEFDKLKEAHHGSIMILQAEGKKLRTNFFNGLTLDPANNNVDSSVNKIAENQKQIELITYNHFKEVKKICTPEQKLIFNDIIQEVLERLGRQEKDPR